MSSPAQRLNAISQQGLCIGCGLCQDIAGSDTVRVALTPEGVERPIIVGDLDHATVDAIYRACPGVKVTGLPAVDAAGATIDPVWGPWRRIVMAHAADPEVRHLGSTGGALTALGMHLLAMEQVDAILHAAPHPQQPGFGAAHISTTPDEVLAATGSRYGPTAVLTRLDEALRRFDRLAVIAKPCDLSALRLRGSDDPRIGKRVTHRLTMVCGGIMTPSGLAERMIRFGADPETVTGVRYRGHGCPGATRFEMGERAIEISYLDFWGKDQSSWTIPYRCKICPDGTGETADIAAADVWPGGSPTEDMLTGDPGTNVVIARTAVGEQLLAAAVGSGHLVVGESATIGDLDLWQPHHVKKKRANWARQMGRRRAGVLPIRTESLRSEQLARTQPVGQLLAEARGSARRVRDGSASEPVPVATS